MEKLERIIFDIEQQATRRKRACGFRANLEIDLDIIEKLARQAKDELKICLIADVGERYLAIGTLASGKSFRYVDNAVDMRAFANYINEIYPNFEVDAIIAV